MRIARDVELDTGLYEEAGLKSFVVVVVVMIMGLIGRLEKVGKIPYSFWFSGRISATVAKFGGD